MSTKGIHYIAYVRVSSYEQAERNLSIPSQIDQIQQYARKGGYIIDRIFSEEHSAYRGARPVFKELLQEVRKSKTWKGIIVFKFDRISRNLDDFLALEKALKEKSMEAISVTEPMLNSYLWRYLVRDMQNRAILYSEELSFRIRLWLRKKLQTGWDIGGSPPFWFKRVNGYFLPDENKAPIIVKIFSLHATGKYWCKEIAKMVRKQFNLPKFGHTSVHSILINSIYTGTRTKIWNLTTEEYLFWWAEKPGDFIESYPLDYITPIISQEVFDTSTKIREGRARQETRTGTAVFPKIFECSCGRRLARDDKKGRRYLRCPRQINAKFTAPCTERYSPLTKLETYLESVLREIILTPEIRKEAMHKLIGEMGKLKTADNHQTLEILKKIDALKEKVDHMTESYINEQIPQEVFEPLVTKLNSEIKHQKIQLELIGDNELFIKATKRTIRLLEALGSYESILDMPSWAQKSSQTFSITFKVIANLVFKEGFPHKKDLFEPFNMVQKGWFSNWWRWREPPPCPWRSPSTSTIIDSFRYSWI